MFKLSNRADQTNSGQWVCSEEVNVIVMCLKYKIKSVCLFQYKNTDTNCFVMCLDYYFNLNRIRWCVWIWSDSWPNPPTEAVRRRIESQVSVASLLQNRDGGDVGDRFEGLPISTQEWPFPRRRVFFQFQGLVIFFGHFTLFSHLLLSLRYGKMPILPHISLLLNHRSFSIFL